jgi:Chromosome segregation protein Csm1/Pcs1
VDVTEVGSLQEGVDVALHYKLRVDDSDPHGQMAYEPLLDSSRDETLLKVLPEYFTDEIMFTRSQGPRRANSIANV